MSDSFDFGLIGLGVMGRNFILNVADHGYSACGYNRSPSKVDDLIAEAGDRPVKGTADLKEFVQSLKRPRKIMLLVKAGRAVDAVIEDLLPYLDADDLIIDGGNTYFTDTDRRQAYLEEKGFQFLGTGVSGGSKGARLGPSMMPGGSPEAYALVKGIFEAVAAKVQDEPCVTYLGPRSAGHYVKMVHNGIEYGLMQLIADTYEVMRTGLGWNNEQLAKVFTNYNQGRLHSYLIEITSMIFHEKEPEAGGYFVDYILDKAKQKGTGKWTSQHAMDLGIPVPTIDVAVTMRELSSFKAMRSSLAKSYPPPTDQSVNGLNEQQLEEALYSAFLLTYAQGMHLLAAASEENEYALDLAKTARIWRGGCIIRAALLEDIYQAYRRDTALVHLMQDQEFQQRLRQGVPALRQVVTVAQQAVIPVPALSATLAYFDAFRSAHLPMNLVQAQRDYFGSHTFERTDREGIFHHDWKGSY